MKDTVSTHWLSRRPCGQLCVKPRNVSSHSFSADEHSLTPCFFPARHTNPQWQWQCTPACTTSSVTTHTCTVVWEFHIKEMWVSVQHLRCQSSSLWSRVECTADWSLCNISTIISSITTQCLSASRHDIQAVKNTPCWNSTSPITDNVNTLLAHTTWCYKLEIFLQVVWQLTTWMAEYRRSPALCWTFWHCNMCTRTAELNLPNWQCVCKCSWIRNCYQHEAWLVDDVHIITCTHELNLVESYTSDFILRAAQQYRKFVIAIYKKKLQQGENF